VATAERFQDLVSDFAGRPGVGQPGEGASRGFGADALKVHGHIFAMISHDRLVVKLPAGRVAALIAGGTGAAFDAGKGKPMKEWLTVISGDDETWTALAHEAYEFVGARAKRH
jgi:hypothetical protein